jgi:hypothetical protein
MATEEKQAGKFDIHCLIEYDADENNCPFKIKTDIKKERLPDVIEETIMAYADHKVHFSDVPKEDDEKIKIFKIGVKIDLTDDSFKLSTNGSENITIGILAYLLEALKTDKVKFVN